MGHMNSRGWDPGAVPWAFTLTLSHFLSSSRWAGLGVSNRRSPQGKGSPGGPQDQAPLASWAPCEGVQQR